MFQKIAMSKSKFVGNTNSLDFKACRIPTNLIFQRILINFLADALLFFLLGNFKLTNPIRDYKYFKLVIAVLQLQKSTVINVIPICPIQ